MLVGQNPENAVTLTKGVEVSLAKAAEETGTVLKNVTIGLGWDRQAEPGEPEFDADSVAIVLDKDGKLIPGIMPLIFYNNLTNENGSIVHSKDNRTGEGAGYDETIKIKFDQLDAKVGMMIIGLSIHGAPASGQNFGRSTMQWLMLLMMQLETLQSTLTSQRTSLLQLLLMQLNSPKKQMEPGLASILARKLKVSQAS